MSTFTPNALTCPITPPAVEVAGLTASWSPNTASRVQHDVNIDIISVDSDKVVIYSDFDIGVGGCDGIHGEGH
jgi:tRNA A37 N6-isopentenylltransferase MiaA